MTTEQFIAYYNGLEMHERIKILNSNCNPYDGAEQTQICYNLGNFTEQLAHIFRYDPHTLADHLNEIDEGASCWFYCEGNLHNIWDLDGLTEATGKAEDIADYYAAEIE